MKPAALINLAVIVSHAFLGTVFACNGCHTLAFVTFGSAVIWGFTAPVK